MDFWSRLLAGTSLSSGSSRKDDATNPTRRLHRFDKEYSQILQIWRSTPNLTKDDDAAEALEIRLQELINILTDETRRPLPHPCIQYASKKQIYISIGKIATSSYNEWIIKQTVSLFATLVETDEEAFVENPTFSASLTNLLVRITGVNSVRLASDTEAKVVELAFNITTKIRLDRDILPAWFKTDDGGRALPDLPGQHDTFAGRTQKQDFPLFYILMDYIHHDGKVGDFARTGLLYIIESAASSEQLEQWIVESDLSTLMATGLGALYSQLSRKLVIDHQPHELPPVLALSDYQHPTSTYEIVSSCSPEFQLHLETFLSHLLFWQDVLEHCKSVEVKQTLLEHFQVIFLQQLLYPSLLESSDIDGGSSVAVLTYLKRILESLDHPDMINLILHYLLGLPDHMAPRGAGSRTSISDARKRKSMDLASMMAQTNSDLSASPLLFNLVDLILACLRSHNQQTIHVTLQLVSAILKRHHRYAVLTLLRTEGTRGETAQRTIGAHEQEIEYLMTLASSIGGQENFDAIYESVLKDTTTRIEGHPCSLKMIAPRISTNNHELPPIPDSLPGAPRDVREHTLRPDDPLLSTLVDLLETFFINPVDTNLSLTETIIDLAVCGYMAIEGWLLRSPQRYAFEEHPSPPASPTTPKTPATPLVPLTDDIEAVAAEAQKLKDVEDCRRSPLWQTSSLPRILVVLQQLCKQVTEYRGTVPRFDDLLQMRRDAFSTADSAYTTPMPQRRGGTPHQHSHTQTPERPSMDGVSRSASPARPSALEGFAQRLLSEISTPSRTGTPRGRSNSNRGSGAASPTPAAASSMAGGYGINTPSARPPVPPKEFPLNLENPTRSGPTRGYSPASSIAKDDLFDPVAASQQAAFAQVDQSILARRVGLPDGKLEAIPLRLEKPRQEPGGERFTPHLPPPQDQEEDDDDDDEHDEDGDEARGEDSNVLIRPDDDDEDGDDDGAGSDKSQDRTASVSHIITNVIILQSFLFELAALVQVRAGVFNEVRFA
ncbi:Retinoic acid induced 16-like protein-domain-containing protein [Plectosphaerella plurivora]|uniref:Retinoic acid induced 16-like protein-domain-containing protein n=1 Tax=Plectosphaerella plurivora TaxID=936078 RepID=A0A9P8V3E8_9PEZI|nr:Retinoic acid induced 16-like protein-domain-containing protein [Plectosphaerella plurivora]